MGHQAEFRELDFRNAEATHLGFPEQALIFCEEAPEIQALGPIWGTSKCAQCGLSRVRLKAWSR